MLLQPMTWQEVSLPRQCFRLWQDHRSITCDDVSPCIQWKLDMSTKLLEHKTAWPQNHYVSISTQGPKLSRNLHDQYSDKHIDIYASSLQSKSEWWASLPVHRHILNQLDYIKLTKNALIRDFESDSHQNWSCLSGFSASCVRAAQHVFLLN
jgi:hypothetical protein